MYVFYSTVKHMVSVCRFTNSIKASIEKVCLPDCSVAQYLSLTFQYFPHVLLRVQFDRWIELFVDQFWILLVCHRVYKSETGVVADYYSIKTAPVTPPEKKDKNKFIKWLIKNPWFGYKNNKLHLPKHSTSF